jgi:hypothetical protein
MWKSYQCYIIPFRLYVDSRILQQFGHKSAILVQLFMMEAVSSISTMLMDSICIYNYEADVMYIINCMSLV